MIQAGRSFDVYEAKVIKLFESERCEEMNVVDCIAMRSTRRERVVPKERR